jgi:hypothetical protein
VSTPRSRVFGSTIESIEYVDDDADAVESALAGFVRRPDPVDLVLTAGAASTDPLDACFVAIAALGGRVVRRGVPRPSGVDAVARADRRHGDPRPADLRRLLEGDGRRPPAAAAALGREAVRGDGRKLGHGGILTRSQRFRFPAYARELDAPDG